MNEKKPVYSWILLIIAISLTVFIIVQSCLPGAESTLAASPIVDISADVVNAFKPGTIPEVRPDWFVSLIRKLVGHFGLFGFLSIFCYFSFYFFLPKMKINKVYSGFLFSTIYGALLALLTETIQLFVPGRSGSFVDSSIDFAGYLIATIIVTLIILLAVNKNKKAPKDA